MGGIDAPALLAFAAGIISIVAAFAANYFLDYRLTKRQLEFDERSSVAGVLGARPGQLRRAAKRLESRIASFDRDAKQVGAWLTSGKEAAWRRLLPDVICAEALCVRDFRGSSATGYGCAAPRDNAREARPSGPMRD